MHHRLVAACYRVDDLGSGSRVKGFQGLGFRVSGVGAEGNPGGGREGVGDE
jgi:hypothetical protein